MPDNFGFRLRKQMLDQSQEFVANRWPDEQWVGELLRDFAVRQRNHRIIADPFLSKRARQRRGWADNLLVDLDD